MENLSIYLKHLRFETLPFSRKEINEPLIAAYDAIEWAVQARCAVIEITPQRVVWKKEEGGRETIVGEFPTPVSFKPYFEMIVSRDPMVQAHLQLSEETDTTAKYHIKDM